METKTRKDASIHSSDTGEGERRKYSLFSLCIVTVETGNVPEFYWLCWVCHSVADSQCRGHP